MSNINSLLNQTPGDATAAQNTNSKSRIDASKLTGTTEQFLQILLAQLKHQDPLEPMKGTEFIDSISRLSGVEQSINTNTYLERLVALAERGNSTFGDAASYINKVIEFNSSQIALKDSTANISYELDENSSTTNLRMIIKNSFGDVIVDTTVQNEPGINNITWDGKDLSGNTLNDGLYTIAIVYKDPASRDPAKPDFISVPTFTTGKVTEANFTGVEPFISVGGIEIPLTAVRKLYGSDV